MCGTQPDRKPSAGPRLLAAALVIALPLPARAGQGLLDTVLETMDLKASPPGPAPGFVERTRPDPAGLGYMPTATPHKVSPLPVKTADQVQAQKDALDAARDRQLHPEAPKPLAPAGTKPGKGRAAHAAD